MKPKCYFPFTTPSIVPTGISQCCMPNVPVIDNMSIDEFYHSEYMRDLRQQMLGEKPINKNCQDCLNVWDNTDGLEHDADCITYDVDAPLTYELLSVARTNECNQACRMCQPRISTTLGNLHRKLGLQDCKQELYEFDLLPTMKEHGHKVRHISISGGLPTMDEGLLDIWDTLDPNVVESFIITTNGTHFPDEFLNSIKRFKKAKLTFCISIDGDKNVSEALRLFSKNDDSYKSLQSIHERMQDFEGEWNLSIQSVISNVTLFRFKPFFREILKNPHYQIQMNTICFGNFLWYPEEMSFHALPKSRKEDALKYIQATREVITRDMMRYTEEHKERLGVQQFDQIPFFCEFLNMLHKTEKMLLKTMDVFNEKAYKNVDNFHRKYDAIKDGNLIKIVKGL